MVRGWGSSSDHKGSFSAGGAVTSREDSSKVGSRENSQRIDLSLPVAEIFGDDGPKETV